MIDALVSLLSFIHRYTTTKRGTPAARTHAHRRRRRPRFLAFAFIFFFFSTTLIKSERVDEVSARTLFEIRFLCSHVVVHFTPPSPWLVSWTAL